MIGESIHVGIAAGNRLDLVGDIETADSIKRGDGMADRVPELAGE
jgi:hypothetical protein